MSDVKTQNISRFYRVAPAAGLLIWLGLLFHSWLNPAQLPVGMDFLNLTYPRFIQASETYAAGQIPLWNWMQWGGAPLLATSLGSVLYPPMWIAFAFKHPYTLQMFAFLHIAWFGLGIIRLYCNLELPGKVVGQFTAAFFACGSAFLINRLDQVQVIATISWAPWIILSARNLLLFQKSPILLAATVAMSLLAGHAQYTIIIAAFTGLALVVEPLRSHESSRWVRLLKLTPFILAGALIAAPQILPTMELSALSERIWPWADPTAPHLTGNHIPAFFQANTMHDLSNTIHGRPFGHTEQAIYSGLLFIPLVVLGAIFAIRTGRRSLLAQLIIALLFLLLAFGKTIPGWETLWVQFPIWKQTRGAARLLLPVLIALALVAGYAMAWLHSHKYGRILVPLLFVFTATQQFLHHNKYWPGLLGPSQSILARLNTKDAKQRSGNLYRFMQDDSALYTSDKPAELHQRIQRRLPNLNSLNHEPVIDGYEEGMLPTRAHANFIRKFNRNLRNAQVDAPLLALLRSAELETDFPPPVPGSDWAAISGTEPQRHQSNYTPAVAISPSIFGSHAPDNLGLIYGTNRRIRTPVQHEVQPHPLLSIDASAWANARLSDKEIYNHNQFNFDLPAETTHAILLIPPSPGWRVHSPHHAEITPITAVFYEFKSNSLKIPEPATVALRYTPYSFRLGLFVGFIALCITISTLTSRRLLFRNSPNELDHLTKPNREVKTYEHEIPS